MNDASRQYEPDPGLPVGEIRLPEGLRFVDVETSLDGRVAEVRAMTRFVPQGYATPTWIHIADEEEKEYTLIVNPLNGVTEIRDGRVQMERKGL